MKQAITAKSKAQSKQINRYAYILYMILVIYLVFKGDYDWALTNMGVALVFDPFDPSVKWQDRPRYQKTWLLLHLAIMAMGFVYIFLIK
jgi:tetratricopeptide (TPR) repeat protein